MPEKSPKCSFTGSPQGTVYLSGVKLRWGSQSDKIHLPLEVTLDIFACI